jgi:probable phosphoglycerate mutase
MTLYLLRHGQTQSSRNNVFCGSGSDPQLTDDGRAMAEAFAQHYGTVDWSAIYCSPLRRARETAAPLCLAQGATPVVRSELAEIAYGRWEGCTLQSVQSTYHDDYQRWSADPGWNAPTGGETAIQIARRCLDLVDEVRGRFSGSEKILFVSHKATIRILVCALLGIDVGRFRQRLGCPVGSVSLVEFTSHGPLLKALADCSHMNDRLRSLPGT